MAKENPFRSVFKITVPRNHKMATIRTQYFAISHFGNVLAFVSACKAGGMGSALGRIPSVRGNNKIRMLKRLDCFRVVFNLGWLVLVIVLINAGVWMDRIREDSAS